MSDTLYPRFSEAEFARRNALIKGVMKEVGASALLVYGTPNAYGEIQYLSNFPVTREALLVFPLEGEPTLFVQMFNHVPTARQVSCIQDVRWGGPDTLAIAAKDLQERGFMEQRIGIVGPIPFQRYAVLPQTLLRASFVDFTRHMLSPRLVKSEEELAFLRRGAKFSDLAIEALQREVRPGITEHQLTTIVENAYLGLGGKTHIHYMATTPMHSPTVCVPAQYQSNRVLEKGDVLITEISALYHGYAGQILRPFTIAAPPTAEYQRLYEVAVEAFNRIASVIRAGATTEAVLDAADYIHEAGFTIYDDLLHGFGGGYLPPILRTHQTSAVSSQPFTFRENMTIVIQPNVISKDERMGVQVGELVRVTATGVESLHSYPMSFIRCA